MSETNLIKVLCVEDEQDLRENMATILQAEGYSVIEAENGQDGFEKFVNNKPDVILCDINMPIMDGRQLLDKLQTEKSAEMREVPFIFLTALGQKDDKLIGLKLGADDYIVKPVDFDILLSTIQLKLRKTQAHQDATKEKLVNLCEKVSNLVPKEVQQPLQHIITLSATLKKELQQTPGAKQHITEYATKIYLAALKLNSQVARALDKDKIMNEANNIDEFISVFDLMHQVRNDVGNDEILYEYSENLPDVALKKSIFIPVLVNYIKQHLRSETKNLKINTFQDYSGNFVISISGQTIVPVFSEELEDTIAELNGEFRVQSDGEETYHILSLPQYVFETVNL